MSQSVSFCVISATDIAVGWRIDPAGMHSPFAIAHSSCTRLCGRGECKLRQQSVGADPILVSVVDEALAWPVGPVAGIRAGKSFQVAATPFYCGGKNVDARIVWRAFFA